MGNSLPGNSNFFQSLSKTFLLEKKMLVTHNFSFSPTVFSTHSETNFDIWVPFKESGEMILFRQFLKIAIENPNVVSWMWLNSFKEKLRIPIKMLHE